MAVLPFRDELVASNCYVYYGDAVPTSGDFNVGDLLVVTNTSVASPGIAYPALYRCTTASSSHNGGTWTAVGTGVSSAGSPVASGGTISPTTTVLHVSGTSAINTITPPAGLPSGSTVTLIPDGLFTTTISGNIASTSTAVVNKAMIMTWDGTKFYPSY